MRKRAEHFINGCEKIIEKSRDVLEKDLNLGSYLTFVFKSLVNSCSAKMGYSSIFALPQSNSLKDTTEAIAQLSEISLKP